MPGGFIYINRGLIERTQNMSQVAGVLGADQPDGEVEDVKDDEGEDELHEAKDVVRGGQRGVQAKIQTRGQPEEARRQRTIEADADLENTIRSDRIRKASRAPAED